jgi:hypothetical protein
LSRLADVKVGLQTGDNDFYLSKRATARGSYRTVDEARILTTAELGALTSDEKLNGLDPSNWGDRTIVPYDKGGASDADDGWMPNYWVPTEYFIDWSRANVDRLKTGTLATIKRGQGRAADIRPGDDQRIASRFQNVAYYFRPGITFSSRGVYAPTFRMTGGGPFDKESSALFLTAADGGQPHPLLGYLASRFARYAFKNFIQHTVSNDQGALENLPIPVLNSPEFLRIGELAAQIIQRQAQDPRYPYHLHEQLEIDALVYRAFALTPDDIREVELWFCRRYPAAFTTALGLLQRVHIDYADHLARCEMILSKPPGYWRSHPVLQLVAQGEGQRIEFKETLAVDARDGSPKDAEKTGTLKEVAGFLNAEGGSLLIGVSNAGEIKGIASDLPHCNRQNTDGFEQKIRELIAAKLQPAPVGTITVSFPVLPEGTVCQIDVPRSATVIHLENQVFLRDGNTTRSLTGPNLTAWITARQ